MAVPGQWQYPDIGCPRHKRAGVYVAPSEKTIRRVSGLCDHDLADDLLCGWTGELAAACEVLSPAKLQERRRDKARKAKARARKAARRERGARELSHKQARKAARRERKAAAAAIAAAAQAVAGGRAKLPAGSSYGHVPVPATHPALPAAAYGDPRHVPALRGLGADGKASRGAKLNGQEVAVPGHCIPKTAASPAGSANVVPGTVHRPCTPTVPTGADNSTGASTRPLEPRRGRRRACSQRLARPPPSHRAYPGRPSR